MSATNDEPNRTPVLICIGGLPATGKTTVARTVAAELRAAYVRIDSIETAINRAEGQFQQTASWDLPAGYVVGYDVAADQLRNGLDVVAESVNPFRASRDAWRDAGLQVGARVVEVKIVCSDVDAHRRRAEERVLDIAELTKPTWEQITNREYDPWERDRVVVDTAILGIDDSTEPIRTAVGDGARSRRRPGTQRPQADPLLQWPSGLSCGKSGRPGRQVQYPPMATSAGNGTRAVRSTTTTLLPIIREGSSMMLWSTPAARPSRTPSGVLGH